MPYYSLLAADSLIVGVHKRFGIGWPGGDMFFYNNDQLIWYGSQKAVDQKGVNTARLIYGKGGRLRMMRKWYDDYVRQLAKKREQLTPGYLRNLNDKALIAAYKQFIELYQHWWHTAVHPETIGYGISAYLEKPIKKLSPKNSGEVLTILSSPADYSFYQKEEIDLLEILSKPSSDQKELIKKHAEKYNWILNNYATGKPIDAVYFENRTKELSQRDDPKQLLDDITTQFNSTQRKRQQIIDKLPEGETKLFASKLGKAVAWHDDRKSWQLRSQTTMHYFLLEFSRHFSMALDDMLQLRHEELVKVLEGNRQLPSQEIAKREQLFLVHFDDKSFETYTGEKAQRVFSEYRKTSISNRVQVKGIVASKGESDSISGPARILRSPQQAHHMLEGEILVAESTSPDYIVAIRRAKAIVTDAGGLTSHASVVSRELGIPCIVNTKYATSILTNGDIIDVDTVHGTVTVVDRSGVEP